MKEMPRNVFISFDTIMMNFVIIQILIKIIKIEMVQIKVDNYLI